MQTKSGVVGPGADRTEVYRSGQRVVLMVKGYHDVQAAHDAIAYVHLLMADMNDPIEFIADLRHITGFDEDCRAMWQDGLRPYTGRIDLITLVQGTPLAKVAASALGLYLGIRVRSIGSSSTPDSAEIFTVLRGPS